MIIHPRARPLISKLSLPTPIQKYFSNLKWKIDLSNNTNPYGGEFSNYPDVKQDALKELYLKTLLSINVTYTPSTALNHANVLFTAGSMEGIDLILRTFCEPLVDFICVTVPSFSAYSHWALLHGVGLHVIPLLGDDFDHLDITTILNLTPKMVFICNPNNPTGTTLSLDKIEKLCRMMNGFVVVDEAYIEFSNDLSCLTYLSKYNNLIILRTFSKAWGLAGVRCGAVLADESIINALRYVQLPFSFASHSQRRVKTRLQNPQSALDSWERIKKSRKELIEELLILKGVSQVFKSHANFVMLVLKNFQKTLKLLTQHQIYVLDCSSSVSNAIRVSIGTENQNQKFLEAMREASNF